MNILNFLYDNYVTEVLRRSHSHSVQAGISRWSSKRFIDLVFKHGATSKSNFKQQQGGCFL